jgi:hypothetical protein
MIKIHVHPEIKKMQTLTLRAAQKYAIHPPKIKNAPSICSNLFQNFKRNLGYTKKKKKRENI